MIAELAALGSGISYQHRADTPQIQRDFWDAESEYDTLSPFNVHGTRHTIVVSESSLRCQLLQIHSARGTSTGFELIVSSDDPCIEKSGRQLLHEVRQLTGLSWSQIAELANVSTRTVHNWSGGQQLAQSNHQKLGQLVSTLRYIDKGNSTANRNALFADAQNGSTCFQLLAQSEYSAVKQIIGAGSGRTEKSPSLIASNRPSKPESFSAELTEESKFKVDSEVRVLPTLSQTKAPVRKR